MNVSAEMTGRCLQRRGESGEHKLAVRLRTEIFLLHLFARQVLTNHVCTGLA